MGQRGVVEVEAGKKRKIVDVGLEVLLQPRQRPLELLEKEVSFALSGKIDVEGLLDEEVLGLQKFEEIHHLFLSVARRIDQSPQQVS